MRAGDLPGRAVAIELDDDLRAALFHGHALGAGFDDDAFVAQDLRHPLRHVGVLARDDARHLLDDRDPRPEPPVHLAELETDVAAADDDQVLGEKVDVHHRRVGQKRDVVETRHRRHERAAADIDEDSARPAAGRRSRAPPSPIRSAHGLRSPSRWACPCSHAAMLALAVSATLSLRALTRFMSTPTGPSMITP